VSVLQFVNNTEVQFKIAVLPHGLAFYQIVKHCHTEAPTY